MSLIDELKPKMVEEQRKQKQKEEELKNQPKPKYTEEEEYYREKYKKIKGYIKDMVSEAMNNGNPPPDIKHYYFYYYHCYNFDGLNEEEVERLDELNFYVFRGGYTLLNEMKEKLEDYIKNKIGYKYCEVVLEDKIFKEDKKYTSLFGKEKWKVASYPGKALWIHASMNGEGFYKVKSKGMKVRYDGAPSSYADVTDGSYGRQRSRALRESGRTGRNYFR